tara:strand:- start:201 stop:1562 length:1362 start_codon:yes stop_codon:yes gene_type:complete
MTLHLYDTFSKSKRIFEPINPGDVRMYVCGPTVYDYPHVGNARPVIVFDILFRILQHIYGENKVTYVRNITDVDDKIIATAKENNEEVSQLTERTIRYFHEDSNYVGTLSPTVEPKATDHIREMIDIIEILIQKELAYQSEGNVLFSTRKFNDYGKLSGKNLENLIAGARVETESFKKDPSDFVLWKPSKEGEPQWDSPWGKGRPGWHIECSAMSNKYLGNNFDIHGGGQDLIFPHHENEIAQSECAHGEVFSNYWVHNGFVTVEGNKMAKSERNFVTINQLKDKYQGEVIRLTMMLTHYRQPLNWTEENLKESKKILDKWYNFISDLKTKNPKSANVSNEVLNSLYDDINTPQAIADLHKIFKNCKNNDQDSIDLFLNSAQFIGLMNNDPSDWLNWGKESSIDEKQLEILIKKRDEARVEGQYEYADKIRDEIENMGIVLEDKDGKTSWRLR